MNTELAKKIEKIKEVRNRLKRGEYNGNDIMQAWLAIDELIDCKSVLSQQQEAEPVTMNDAIAAGNGTLHGAIDYWQERALKAEAAQPQVPEGIIKIERTFEYFSPDYNTKVVVYFAPDDWEARDRFALWLSAATEEGK